MDASEFGNFDVVKFLVEHGANINAVATSNGKVFTALTLASERKHSDIEKYLLEHGADPKIQEQFDKDKILPEIRLTYPTENKRGRGL